MRNKIGSNQHRTRNRYPLDLGRGAYIRLVVLLWVLLVLLAFFCWHQYQVKIISPQSFLSPLSARAFASSENPNYVPPPMASMSGQIKAKEIIKQTWRKDYKIGVAIASCESGLREDAEGHNTNGTVDRGYFQVNSVHPIDVHDPVANAAYAYVLYKEQGFDPWSASQACWKGRI